MVKTILITGTTGNISLGIIAKLEGSGHNLRALVRNPGSRKSSSGREWACTSATWKSRGCWTQPSREWTRYGCLRPATRAAGAKLQCHLEGQGKPE